MKQFAENVNFAKFLNTFRIDNKFSESLKLEDYSAINSYPGLSEGERRFLKTVDWHNTLVEFNKDPSEEIFDDWSGATAKVKVEESCSPGYCTKKIEVDTGK